METPREKSIWVLNKAFSFARESSKAFWMLSLESLKDEKVLLAIETLMKEARSEKHKLSRLDYKILIHRLSILLQSLNVAMHQQNIKTTISEMNASGEELQEKFRKLLREYKIYSLRNRISSDLHPYFLNSIRYPIIFGFLRDKWKEIRIFSAASNYSNQDLVRIQNIRDHIIFDQELLQKLEQNLDSSRILISFWLLHYLKEEQPFKLFKKQLVNQLNQATVDLKFVAQVIHSDVEFSIKNRLLDVAYPEILQAAKENPIGFFLYLYVPEHHSIKDFEDMQSFKQQLKKYTVFLERFTGSTKSNRKIIDVFIREFVEPKHNVVALGVRQGARPLTHIAGKSLLASLRKIHQSSSEFCKQQTDSAPEQDEMTRLSYH